MKTKRIISILLSFCIMCLLTINVSNINLISHATQTKTSNFSTAFKLSGNYADDIVSVAKAQLNKTGSDLGYSEQWCANFTNDCAKLANIPSNIIPHEYSSRGSCIYMYNYMINNCNSKVVTTPQKGDIVFFDWAGNKNVNNLHHVAIVTGYSNNTVSIIGGNQGESNSLYSRKVSTTSYSINNKYVAKIVRPNYNKAPEEITVISKEFYPPCASSYTSIVDGLKSIGEESSYEYRSTIAKVNGISNYSGTAAQNTEMLNKLKNGTLINPYYVVDTPYVEETPPADNKVYFPKCGSGYTSIVEALKSIGADSSYDYRARIAAANGISGYSGTASQNTDMLNKLKNGTLINPDGKNVTTNPTTAKPVTTSTQTVYTYYQKCGSGYTSLVDALKSIGEDSSFNNRSSIASRNGISGYSGTASQNTEMLNKLKNGSLIKSIDTIVVTVPQPTTTTAKPTTTTTKKPTTTTPKPTTTTTKKPTTTTAKPTTTTTTQIPTTTTTKIITTIKNNSLRYGIDVSKYQGDINWNSVKASGIDFAIIRAGTTTINGESYSQDSCFINNYNGAKSAGIKVGAYYYCGAYSKEGFEKTAHEFLNSLNGKSFEYPVFIDLEQASEQMALGKQELTSYVLSALDLIKNAGYTTGVYANKDWFTNYIDISSIRSAGYEIWLAQYPSGSYAVDPTQYDKSSECSIWQYSSLGSVNGINGYVDVDVYYANNAPMTYFPSCDNKYTSIVDALKSIDVDSSYSNRVRIAYANGINDYTGTASQNIEMLNKLKNGILVNPEPSPTTSFNDIKYADSNCDDQIDMSDVVLIMQSLSNPNKYGTNGTDKSHITLQGSANADCDKRTEGITTNDALAIQLYLLGKVDTLPIK